MKKILYVAALCLVSGWVLASVFSLGTGGVRAEKNAAAAGKFMLVTMPLNAKSWTFIKYNTSTGEVWDPNGDTFTKLVEPGPIPTGDYEVQMIIMNETKILTRIDKTSGRTWYLSQNKFIEMK